jgi:cytochrome c
MQILKLKDLASSALLAVVMSGIHASAWSVDADAADRLVKDNKCTKCHDVERKKDAPAYRDIAAKYRGDPEAEKKLAWHVTSGEKVKFADGHEEKHKKVKSDDANAVPNLVGWILTLQGGTKY